MVRTMNGFLGADTAQLREISALFVRHGHRLLGTMEDCRQLAQTVTWVGPDADAFRAECVSATARMASLAARVEEQGADLRVQADQQDEASSESREGGGSWRPDIDHLRKIVPWADAPLRAPEEVSLSETAKRLMDKTREAVLGALDRILEGGPEWWRGARRLIPVVPDLLGMADDLVHGDTPGFIVGHARVLTSFGPLGVVEDASGLVFPLLPDDWMYPGTDVPLNEGSLLDGAETMFRQAYESDMWQAEYIRQGERDALEISDRLGIENQYVRNAFKVIGGTAGASRAGQLDPQTGAPWVLSAPWGELGG